MAHQLEEGCSIFDPPHFDSQNFAFWKCRFQAFICAFNFDMWDVIEMGYEKPIKEINDLRFELPFFELNEKKILNKKT